MSSQLSKIRSVHMYVMSRTVYFGWICNRGNPTICLKTDQRDKCLSGSVDKSPAQQQRGPGSIPDWAEKRQEPARILPGAEDHKNKAL